VRIDVGVRPEVDLQNLKSLRNGGKGRENPSLASRRRRSGHRAHPSATSDRGREGVGYFPARRPGGTRPSRSAGRTAPLVSILWPSPDVSGVPQPAMSSGR